MYRSTNRNPAHMRNIRQQITKNLIPVFRRKLSGVDALPQLAVLGLLSGILTGVVILLFRFAIEWPLEHFLPGVGSENFEQLDIITREIGRASCRERV